MAAYLLEPQTMRRPLFWKDQIYYYTAGFWTELVTYSTMPSDFHIGILDIWLIISQGHAVRTDAEK